MVAPGAAVPSAVPPILVVSLDHVIARPLPEGDGHHPGATSSDDPRPPGREPPLGVSSDVSASRERPAESLQNPKEPSATMLNIHTRLRNLAELLKLHFQRYHMSPAQFRHRTSNLRLPEDIHELYKRTLFKIVSTASRRSLQCKGAR